MTELYLAIIAAEIGLGILFLVLVFGVELVNNCYIRKLSAEDIAERKKNQSVLTSYLTRPVVPGNKTPEESTGSTCGGVCGDCKCESEKNTGQYL